ncbi:MAG: metallophosphoesterase [Frankiales bacterium]|nr:metallophosphoesterase [Frankiales bacterium]
MRLVRVFQLGDVHYPGLGSQTPMVDLKDQAFPSHLAKVVHPIRLQNVIKALLAELDEPPAETAVMICGDLTSYGLVEPYRDCVGYLVRGLSLDDTTRWSPDAIHVVPGNHDVDRDVVLPGSDDLFAKFKAFKAIWDDAGLPVLDPEAVRATSLASGACSIGLFSLNSCIGCGEWRHLPDYMAEHLRELLAREMEAADDFSQLVLTSVFSDVWERLDTPAFVEEQVSQLVRAIQTLPMTSVPVVLAHHNLLPQSVPRIDVYTELINSGLIRSRLSTLGRTVFYLHGHIHDDPIETIVRDSPQAGRLVCVSAPELTVGFNELLFTFTRHDIPIGCTIRRHRLRQHGGVDVESEQRIRLIESDVHADPRIKTVVDAIGTQWMSIYDLWQHLKTQGDRISRPVLQDLLLEAEWSDLVVIKAATQAPRLWRVRRPV